MDGLALASIFLATLSALWSACALPRKPLFLSQLTERGGEFFLREQDADFGGAEAPDLLQRLQHHTDSITANTRGQIETAREVPLWYEGRSRRRRDEEETEELLIEVGSDFYELLQINKTIEFSVDSPGDLETVYYNDDVYIIVTGVADTATSNTTDSILIFYYDQDLNTVELVLTQEVELVQDVDYFTFEDTYYLVAAQWGDDEGGLYGSLLVFLWNIEDSRSSQSLFQVQKVWSINPTHVETLVAGDSPIIVASETLVDTLEGAAVMYEWKGGHMDQFAVFPKPNIARIIPFCIHSRVFVGVVSAADGDGNYATSSDVLLYNLHLHKFETFQSINTYGAIDLAVFTLGSGFDTEAFLLIANEYPEKGSTPRSIIYKYNYNTFEPFQCLEIANIQGWHVITDQKALAAMLIYTSDEVKFYQYDGWVFQETEVQFQESDLTPPVIAMSSQFADLSAALFVATDPAGGGVCTLFTLTLNATSLARRFQGEAEDECRSVTDIYRTIVNKHRQVEEKVDEVIRKDGGKFVYSGNVTFLGNFSAEDSITKDIDVDDGPLLTEEEEAQLEEIRQLMANNSADLSSLEKDLPNTMLVNTTAQSVAGLKTFDSITADGDIASDSLTVTSDTVNSDIDIQDLSDTYIDTTAPQDLTIGLTLGGGIDVLGDLALTGLLDGVDMTEVVTLSGDHTITGGKTFGAVLTAQRHLDVDGTVDGVTLTSTTVLLTSGAQTVAGALTFSGGLTAKADVSVTGEVDTVDLSTLSDEAFYLNGTNDVTGNLQFTGPVTLGGGLDVAAGSTVDGMDIRDAPNILRKSVPQNVTATYTFTSPLTIDADITVEGTVDNVLVPSEIVLIDDPNPMTVSGPLTFEALLNVSCLLIRDKINTIRAPNPYTNLDLFLTSPRLSKRQQRLLGNVDFSTDVTVVSSNLTLTGRLDGVDVADMADDTVYVSGNQTVTGLKTFSGDVTVDGSVQVGQNINSVDINDLDEDSVKLSDGAIQTTGDLTFQGDITFQGAVRTGGSHTFGDTLTISDLVTQSTTETIGGAKTFTAVTAEEDVLVSTEVNEVPIDTLFSDAVRLDDPSTVSVTATWTFGSTLYVMGDLSVSTNIDGIDLDDAVTITGDQTITGIMTFSKVLRATVNVSIAGDLTLSDGMVNGYNVQNINGDTFKCSGAQTVTGKKTFDTLTVEDNIVISGTISDIDVSDIYDDAVFITGDQSIAGTKTFVAETTVGNAVFNDLVDGIRVPEFFFEVLTQGTTQTVLGHLETSNVILEANLTVYDTVNELVIEDLWQYSAKTTDATYSVQMSFVDVESEDDVGASGTVDDIVISRDVVLADATGQAFTGKKTFKSSLVFEEDVAVVIVNGVDILDLWGRTLKNVGDQMVTATKTFSAGITVSGNISVTGTVDTVDVSDFANRVVVTSDVEGAVQTITAAVTFTDVIAQQDIYYTGTLQMVNLQTLNASYVSRSESDQTIAADKIFSATVTVLTGGSLDVTSLDLDGTFNTWDLDTLYEEAWISGSSAIVYDVKTFQQCITMEDDLTVDGTVDGVDISENVMTTNENQQVTGFKIFSSNMDIALNLNFGAGNQIDGVDVSDWGLNAARMSSSYTITVDLTFENVDFGQSVSVVGTCNGFEFSPATFMTKSRAQVVSAEKTFQYSVEFAGNMDVTGTVQGVDVEEVDTTSLLTSGEQTLAGSLTFQATPTFSNITTMGLVDGEDVVALYLRTHNTPDLDDFDNFVGDQCNLLDDMHEAFENQAYILRYPELVQTIRTNGRAKWRAHYFNETQWLIQARSKISIDYPDTVCINSFIYQWSEAENQYVLFKSLTLDFAEDVVFFEEGGYLFLAVITSNSSKDCEILNLLPSSAQPARGADFEFDVVPVVFNDISDFVILVYVWSATLDDFLVYQRLSGVGSVSLDHYVDPILGAPCLAVANHRALSGGNMTTDVPSAIYCMDSVAEGFNHHAVIDTLGAIKIHPFVYNNILHLVAANRLDTGQRTFMVESAIWGNFVKEVVIATSAVSDVAVYHFHGHYFVAFANEFEGQLEWEDYEVPITIYRYEYQPDGASSVDLMQEIPAYRVQSLEFFEVYDQLFLVVVNKTSSITIFRYKGMELFQEMHTIPLAGAANLAVYPFKNDPENIHIAATAYMERSSVIPGAPIRTRPVDSVILSLYFQGFDTDTLGCSDPDR